MVKPFSYAAVCIYLASAAAAFAQSSYVFQLPGQALSGNAPQILALGDNDFSRKLGPAANAGFAGANQVLATPNGLKFYIVGTTGVLSANSALGSVTPIPAAIAGTVNDAKVTPDGKYLLVAASHFYVINTATDSLQVQADTGIPNGATPIAIAVSHDAKTAWILTNSPTGSTVSALDLTNFQTSASQLNQSSGANGMVLSPRGLLYVSTNANRILEIDPVTMTVTNLGQISVPGQPGPLQFTPDGNTAYFVNRTVCGTCSPIFQLNVQAHSINQWLPTDGSLPPVIDQVLVAGNNRVFALSLGATTLYDITPSPLALTTSTLSNTAAAIPVNSVFAAAVSNEVPSARYIYLLFNDHNFYRINLSNNGVEQTGTLDPFNGQILYFVPIPAQTGAASVTPINVTQGVTPGGTTVLIAQVLDSAGRPVYGAPVTFSAADPTAGISIATPTVTSTGGGWAQTTITAPTATGNFTVVASSGALTGNFTLNVSGSGTTGGGSNGNSQMSIYAGDGQLLAPNGSTALPLTVKITDTSGNPVPNAQVIFAVTGGSGTVTALNQSVTDAGGLATATFTTGPLPFGTKIQLNKITATSAVGSVEFYEVSQDAPLRNDANSPNSSIVAPVGSRTISVPQGGVLPAGIKVFTFSTAGVPIPNVGLRLADPTNVNAPSPVASCTGLSRGDNNGISTCDVLASCQLDTVLPHTFGAFLSVGEYQLFTFNITVTPGTAALFTPITPLNQTSSAGNSLSLLARITDGCGQPVSVSGLSWAVLQSSAPATLSRTQGASDAGGNVSATVTLGQSAGVVQVQLSGPGVPPIVFNITNQVSVSAINLVSGSGQSALVGQAFAQPVIFFVHDSGNNPVQGASVTFSVSGSASLSSPTTVTTDAQGRAQATITAGNTPGNIIVTATSGTASATAALSSHAAGPSITASSFTNAASGSIGMTPCGFVTVTGTGVASGVQGVIAATSFFGAYPYTLGGLSISVQQGSINVPVPIQAVANDQFGQRANFQAPCELTGSTATVTVTANGATTIVNNVPVTPVQPGIFTFTGSNNKVYGAVIREIDGTYVTSANPARQGEKVYVVATGLGQTTPALITNSAGTGSQNVNLPTLVFLNGRPINGLSARYLFGWVGAYLVEFQIPADAATGVDQSLLVVETSTDGNTFLGVSNTVLIPAVSGTTGGSTGTGGGGTGTGGGGTGTGTGGGGTGTGGGGTGTGGGGTGTGTGGTGTSSATTPTQDEINSWIARGNYVSGQVSLTRSTSFTTTDSLTGGAPTTSTTKADSFSGQFTRTSGTDLSKALNNQLPAGFPLLSPAVGTCTVYTLSSLTNPFPNLTTVNLDAGLQLTSSGPNGTQLATRQNSQFGPTYNANGLSNTYLASGHYTLSGPGGADVGSFSGGLDTVADLVVTNTDNFKLINRSGGVTVSWTGGEPTGIVVISGASASAININGVAITAFICTQNVSAGQFTVPASILAQLPASSVTTAGGISIITRGSFSVTSSGKGARFTAPSGVDILTANNSWVWSFTPQYQ